MNENESIDGDSLAAYWEARADDLGCENDKLRELVKRLGKTADEHWAKIVLLEEQIGVMNRASMRKESRP